LADTGIGLGSFGDKFQASLNSMLNYRLRASEVAFQQGMQQQNAQMQEQRMAMEQEKFKMTLENIKIQKEVGQLKIEEANKLKADIEELLGPAPTVPKATDAKGGLTGVPGIEVTKGVQAKRKHDQRRLRASIDPKSLLPPSGESLLNIEAKKANIARTKADTQRLLKGKTTVDPKGKDWGIAVGRAYTNVGKKFANAGEMSDVDFVEEVNNYLRDNNPGAPMQKVRFEFSFEDISFGKDKMKTINITPEDVRQIERGLKLRDAGTISQAQFLKELAKDSDIREQLGL